MYEQESDDTSENRLVEYISTQRNQGFSDSSIRSALIVGGWNPELVDSLIVQLPNTNKIAAGLKNSKITGFILAIILTSLLGAVTYLLYSKKETPPQSVQINKSTSEVILEDFCTPDIEINPKTSGVNFDSITFEELVDTIQQAKENNDFERLQLIKLALSRVTTDPGENLSQSALYSEALNLNWGYSNSPNWYLNERSYASKEQRFDKLKELNSLFQAMHQAGFTKNFSKGSVQLDGETRNVTRAELNYYRFYFSDFYLNLMKIQASSPQGQATVQSSATVFLAEIALVNDFLPTDSEYQSRGKDWLAKVQYYTGSTSKETLIRSLTENSLEDPGDTSLIVGLIGYLEAREGNIDDGLKLLNCAATKYGDELAMSNLGEIYGWERHRQSFMKTWESAPEASKAGLKKSVNPIYLSEKTLPDDIKKSLYWSLLVEKIDPFRNGIFTYADNQLGWNNIGRIDSIVNMRLISKEEISEASCDMLVTLAKIYPEVPPLYEPSGCIK